MLLEKTKVCCKCKEEKILGEFRQRASEKDGLRKECKQCSSQQDTEYDNSENGKLRRIRYMQSETRKEYDKNRRKTPQYQARRIFYNALRRKDIIRPEICPDCGRKIAVEAHHEDYSQPLEVMWFCRECHCNFHNLKKRRQYTQKFEFRNFAKIILNSV